MKLDGFYHLEYLDYCLHLYCYIHNVSADMSVGLLQHENSLLYISLNSTFYNISEKNIIYENSIILANDIICENSIFNKNRIIKENSII